MKKIQIEEKYRPLIELWIEDLIMNPELQGSDELLGNGNKYCCLGRLCIVAGIDKDEIKYESFIREDLFGYKHDLLPDKFIGEINPGSILYILTTMNDGVSKWAVKNARDELKKWGITKEKYTFPEIADFLEKHIEYYEKEK